MAQPLAHPHEAASALPQRYRIRSGENESPHLVCDEAPRVKVHVRRDYAFSLPEAKELGERTILLDGAGSFGPVLDNKRKLYNLDHHQGCERTFTLATCEQALLLVRSGLDLAEGDWSIYANEPDLDTVLALWVLLNHARVKELRPAARDVLFPMLRLEGAIDANGIEMAEVCGLPAAEFERTKRRLDDLLAREQAVKGGGDWQSLDLEAYTAEMLGVVDAMIYSVEDFRGYASIEEVYGHVEIGERSVAVLCRDDAGIYAVEKLLKERWGDQLAMIALEKEPGHYTLRRASTLSDFDLGDAYSLLNQLDRRVDGRPPGKRWGGSESIGGSPRGSGSALGPSELLRVLGQAFAPIPRWARLRRTLLVTAFAAAFTALGVLACAALGERAGPAAGVAGFGGVLLLGSLLVSRRLSGRRTWLHGWRRPGGARWAIPALLAVFLAVPLRGLFPPPVEWSPLGVGTGLAALALLALGLESTFRGMVHGGMLRFARLPDPEAPARITRPGVVSALLYAAVATAICVPFVWHQWNPWIPPVEETVLIFTAAFGAGLLLARVRERSLSLWPGVAAQLIGGVASAALAAVIAAA